MSAPQGNPPAAACPPTVDELQRQIHQRLDEIIAYCLNDQGPASFLEFETALLGLLRSLGCLLIQLFLQARHDRLDPAAWQARGYRVADPAAERTLKTSCGPVAYVRAFLVPRRGGGPGVHPLDVALGLTRDAYSPLVIGWFCRLATRVSFQVASGLGGMFLGAAPPASAIEEWVLGLARPAYVYLSEGPLPEDDGDVLVIEIDGKAAPTATRAGTGAAARPAGPSRTGLQVSAASGPGETAASGPEEAAEEGGQEQERPQRHAGGDVHVAAGRGRSAARPDQQEGVRDVRFAEVGAGVGAGAGDAPRVPPRDRQDGADRRRRRDVPGAAAAAAVPRRDPDAGRPARAGEALGGGSAVPPGRERGVDAAGSRSWRSCSTRGMCGRCCDGWSRRCGA